jgi:hypothetical protein
MSRRVFLIDDKSSNPAAILDALVHGVRGVDPTTGTVINASRSPILNGLFTSMN